jgi:hypothetical protein
VVSTPRFYLRGLEGRLAKASSKLLICSTPLFRKKAAFQNTKLSWKEQKIWSWIRTRPQTKNDCAGKEQQQITALLLEAPGSNLGPNINYLDCDIISTQSHGRVLLHLFQFIIL